MGKRFRGVGSGLVAVGQCVRTPLTPERKMIKRRKLLGEPMPQQITIKPTPQGQAQVQAAAQAGPGANANTASTSTTSAAVVPPASASAPATPDTLGAADKAGEAPVTGENGTPVQPSTAEFATPNTKSTPSSGTSTPSKVSLANRSMPILSDTRRRAKRRRAKSRGGRPDASLNRDTAVTRLQHEGIDALHVIYHTRASCRLVQMYASPAQRSPLCHVAKTLIYPIICLPPYRSTSPNTRSIVPMIATASGRNACRIIKSAPARWANPGARILHLYGRFVPSETRYTPISPFGASMAEYVSPGGTE